MLNFFYFFGCRYERECVNLQTIFEKFKNFDIGMWQKQYL